MSTEGKGSVTNWIGDLKAGDHAAAQKIWERYFETLVRLARTTLHCTSRAASDEEDVALSALDSFCAAAARGRFPRLDDRDDLWKILVTITSRKAINQVQRQRRLKRGGGRAASQANPPGLSAQGDLLEQIVCPDPTPQFAALLSEECRVRLEGLPDETLRRIALLRMEGYTNEEVAERLGCGLRSVVRKLGLIRKIWLEEQTS